MRDHAMVDLAIDSKLRGCDVVKMKIGDVVLGDRVRTRATAMQQKTGKPVKFELLEPARASLMAWLERRGGAVADDVFPAASITPNPSAPGTTPASSMRMPKRCPSARKPEAIRLRSASAAAAGPTS